MLSHDTSRQALFCLHCRSGRPVAFLYDFYGRAVARCRQCRAFTVWNGSGASRPLTASLDHGKVAQHIDGRVDCAVCTRSRLLFYAVRFRGRIETRCHYCKMITGRERSDPDEAIEACLKSPVVVAVKRYAPRLEDTVISAMEDRWDTLRKIHARQRAEVAVGLRFNVFQRDGFRCRYCGRAAQDGVVLHADHVIPASKGGPTTIDNLVTACIDCNLGKSDKDLTH